jgi:small-conductance mechanosensitive channel
MDVILIVDLAERIRTFFEIRLFGFGATDFTIGKIFYLLIALFLLFYLTEKLRTLLTIRIFPRYKISIGVSQAIASIVKYSLVIIGILVLIQTAGIDLSALGLLAGAVGIGIGFGLQNITNNFLSGLIILFERPVKVGDRIEVGKVTGNIIRISARATTILTNDNIAFIVPNSEFINGQVINWSLNDRNVRFNFVVRADYKEDPGKIKKLLLEVANENQGVLQMPKPDVLFDEFGESSLKFNLRVWTSRYSDNPNVLKSQLYYSVFEKFRESGIKIPYPQRDIHIISNEGQEISEPQFGQE